MAMPENMRPYDSSFFWHRAKITDSIWNQKIYGDARKHATIYENYHSHSLHLTAELHLRPCNIRRRSNSQSRNEQEEQLNHVHCLKSKMQ
jgi:hypothetical protein